MPGEEVTFDSGGCSIAGTFTEAADPVAAALRSVCRQQHSRVQVGEPVQGGQRGGRGVGAGEGEIDPADVVVRQRVADGQQPLVGLPQRQRPRGVPGCADDLPVGSPSRRAWPSWRCRPTVWGATGWSRYSAWQEPGSRRATAAASGGAGCDAGAGSL